MMLQVKYDSRCYPQHEEDKRQMRPILGDINIDAYFDAQGILSQLENKYVSDTSPEIAYILKTLQEPVLIEQKSGKSNKNNFVEKLKDLAIKYAACKIDPSPIPATDFTVKCPLCGEEQRKERIFCKCCGISFKKV